MERQHRYPLHRDFFELPAGKIDGGEDPLLCANGSCWKKPVIPRKAGGTLPPCIPASVISDEKLIYYLAEELLSKVQAWMTGASGSVHLVTARGAGMDQGRKNYG